MQDTIIGSVMDNDGDKAGVTVHAATVFLWMEGEKGYLLLPPGWARALAAILNSAADMAEGAKK